jgi:hypothetical protein
MGLKGVGETGAAAAPFGVPMEPSVAILSRTTVHRRWTPQIGSATGL